MKNLLKDWALFSSIIAGCLFAVYGLFVGMIWLFEYFRSIGQATNGAAFIAIILLSLLLGGIAACASFDDY